MEKQNFEIIGKVMSFGTTNLVIEQKYNGGFYTYLILEQDLEKFSKSKRGDIFKNEIVRVIEDIILLHGKDKKFKFSSADNEKTIEYLRANFEKKSKNGMLEKVVGFCLGADFADIEIFKNAVELNNWHEIQGVTKGIPSGLGFGGYAYSSFFMEVDGLGTIDLGLESDETGCYVIQEVHSGNEGYIVDHHLFKADLLQAVFMDMKDTIQEFYSNNK